MPLDVVKSGLQADRDKNITLFRLVKTIWSSQGVRGFFKGAMPVLIRGFIVNSVTFCCYIQTLKFLK